jgi:hypothetical protein
MPKSNGFDLRMTPSKLAWPLPFFYRFAQKHEGAQLKQDESFQRGTEASHGQLPWLIRVSSKGFFVLAARFERESVCCRSSTPHLKSHIIALMSSRFQIAIATSQLTGILLYHICHENFRKSRAILLLGSSTCYRDAGVLTLFFSRQRASSKNPTQWTWTVKRNHPIVIDSWDKGRRFDSCKVGSILAVLLRRFR